MQSCSVIAATCAQTGEILFDMQKTFQKQEDVIPFISRVCCETPLNKKVAILWDNASAHKARSVKDYLARVDVTAIANIAYSPQYNGIEHVFSDVKPRFRKRLTELKVAGVADFDLKVEVNAAFAATDRQRTIAHLMRSWRYLLSGDPRCPARFQGQQLQRPAAEDNGGS